MNNSVEHNPYTPTGTSEPPRPAASLLFRVLLVIAALNLLFHGALLVFGYSLQFANMSSNDTYFASNFGRAMLFKDCVTGATALCAAILLFCRHRLGWWLAVIHWQWYLIWNAVIVIAAESFGWQFPVRYDQAEIAARIVQCLIYSCIAIAFFSLKPILRLLNVSIANRLTTLVLIFAGTAAVGLLINWWSSIR